MDPKRSIFLAIVVAMLFFYGSNLLSISGVVGAGALTKGTGLPSVLGNTNFVRTPTP